MTLPNASHPPGTPAAEFHIDDGLVVGLLSDQHPDLAHLPLEHVDAGWDNAMFRLGDRLAVRMPRRALGAVLITHEQAWLPQIAERLPLPTPVPIRIGQPGRDYPWPWSVTPWIAGATADQQQPDASQAQRLAAFLRALHIPAPDDAPHNPSRGVPIQQRADAVHERMQRIASKTNLITPKVRAIWQAAIEAPMDIPPTWLHGDLHSRNIVVMRGEIVGIIDWGDMTSGDPATDLASIWTLFAEPHARREALAAYGDISEATLDRARGWAVAFGVMSLDAGLIDNPRHAAIGERTLRWVAAN